MSTSAPAINGAEADLDAYAAQAAHQLGEAVALLRGYLAMLQSGGQSEAELEAAVRGMSAGTDRAQRFVDDLLDLAATTRPSASMSVVALDDAVAAARRRLEAELRETGADVRSHALPEVWADRELLVRLLCHLLRLGLAAGARTIDVGAFLEDGMVRVELRDDGAPAVGDPFAAFGRARGRGPLVGAGVGLTVSRRIVEHHGGTIGLDQDATGATVSTFTLPVEG
jgi:light-regulated signal transduction histidine kinase (bacteriophytochrome)